MQSRADRAIRHGVTRYYSVTHSPTRILLVRLSRLSNAATISTITAVLLLAAPWSVAAQEANLEDVASVEGILRAYYEVVSGPAGETADVPRDRSLHHPDAWVALAGASAEGQPVVNVTDVEGYHGDNAPRAQGFYEWETDRVVSRSGNMVHVWSSYASARTEDGEPYTSGVNSITLWHDGDRWWIMGWMFDTSAGS